MLTWNHLANEKDVKEVDIFSPSCRNFKSFILFSFRLEAKKKLAELKEKFSLEDDFDDLDFGEDDSEENSDLEDTED